MPYRQRRRARLLALLVLAAAPAGCGDDPPTGIEDPTTDVEEPGNTPPAIAPIADRTVVRNTLTPGTVEIDLEIQDADDDTVHVAVDSDDDAVIPDTTMVCGPGRCRLTLTPSPDATAHPTIEVAVADGGGRTETSFVVHVVPLLVTTTEDDRAGSLRRAVADARPGDVIGFDTEGDFDSPRTISLRGQIVLDRSLTIEGPGADALTVSGGNAVRVFKVADGAAVTLRDLTIADGSAPIESFQAPDGKTFQWRLGGGVLVDAGGRLTLRDATLTGNAATASDAGGGGGAAVFEGTLIVLDSRITGNTAADGGGIYTVSLGGAEAATTIEGTTVAGNAATVGGGIANLLGSTVVRASRVVENEAMRGGGIANRGTLLIEPDSRVADNEATLGGGGLYNTGIATLNTAVIERNAAAYGGGLFNENGGTLTVRANSRVSGNTTTGADPNFDVGGGIFNSFEGDASIVESRITDNRASTEGGGIFNWGELTLRESVLAHNGAGSGGGLAVRAGTAAIVGGVIEANAADADGGGGILSAPGNPAYDTVSLTVENTDLLNNTAASRGGGILAADGLLLTAVTIAGNSAPDGGGVWFGGNRGAATIRASAMTDNVADEAGGGFYYEGSAAFGDEVFVTAVVDGSVIEGNVARMGGGIFHNGRQSTLTLRNRSRVAGNTAPEGGGIYQTRSATGRTVIDSSTVRENTATHLGGGILHEAGVLEVRANSGIENNTATSAGGGIHTRHAGPEIVVIIDESGVIANETNGRGGGLFVSAGEITVNGTSCLIIGNVADADGDDWGTGGGIFHAAGDISAVPATRVCFNDPDDITP